MGILTILAIAAIYFVPTIIAFQKGHHSRIAIFALNWFAFTGILWVVALVWALNNPQKIQVINSSHNSQVDDLERLAELKEKGVITEAEFQTKKQKLL